ncbi:ABC transporter substrate-binding protein [Georgenia sp. EYE_87]|uniref:ABC transporter substrate-binding protein n=1 Tax=Georgenia sp. EYE_87 TaxID=2853448 RepID=UPI002004891D|nr:ABC transporter substrate-binding protein [Georgenia sp. EYE_87]MCK6212123.1 ABC transporter substrate-binding protein [Georgenia sp. EYE_87]
MLNLKRSSALALCGVGAVVVASCTTSVGGADGASPTNGDGLSTDQYQVALDYVGGEATSADASLEPVRIGFINVEGGVPSFPEATVAATAAVEYVNEYLGGVQGHPLEISTCAIVQGDEDALKCAQEFANDDSIVSVQLGATPFGTGPIYQTIKDTRALIGFGPFGPQDLESEDIVFYTAAAFASAPGLLVHARDNLGAETLAVAYDATDPGAGANVQMLSSKGPELGIEVTAVPVANASEWTSALTAAGAQTAEAVAVVGGPATCIPATKATDQLGIDVPILAYDFCMKQTTVQELGDYPEWTFVGPQPAVEGNTAEDMVAYLAAMDRYAPADANLGGTASSTFGIVLSQVRAMNAVGVDNLTSETLDAEMKAFTGPVFLGVDSLACGAYAAEGAPSLCTTNAFVSTYEGDGEWTAPLEIETKTLGL